MAKDTDAPPRLDEAQENDPQEGNQHPFLVLPVLPAHDQVTLDELRAHFPTADERCRALTFQSVDEGDLVEDGNKVDSDAILAAGPTFILSTVTILRGLDGERTDLVYLDPALVGVCVDELVRLRALKRQSDEAASYTQSARAAQEAALKAAHDEAIRNRDLVRDAIVNALGSACEAEVAVASGNAADDGALATGVEGVVGWLSRKLATGTADEREQLRRYRLQTARVTSLRASAARLRDAIEATARAPRPVNARALNLQDGRVLCVIDRIYTALRTANAKNKAVALPDLHSIAWFFSSRSGRKSARRAPPPAPPAEPTPKPA